MPFVQQSRHLVENYKPCNMCITTNGIRTNGLNETYGYYRVFKQCYSQKKKKNNVSKLSTISCLKTQFSLFKTVREYVMINTNDVLTSFYHLNYYSEKIVYTTLQIFNVRVLCD
jgi:hypothetical protein